MEWLSKKTGEEVGMKGKLKISFMVILDVFDKLLLNDKLNSNLPIDDLHLNGARYRILVYTLRVFYVSRDE